MIPIKALIFISTIFLSARDVLYVSQNSMLMRDLRELLYRTLKALYTLPVQEREKRSSTGRLVTTFQFIKDQVISKRPVKRTFEFFIS